jgi:DNA topoisomerase-1
VICEREEEIERFKPQEYWTIEADFKKGGKKFTAKLLKYNGEKAEIGSGAQAEAILGSVRNAPFVVKEIDEKRRERRAGAPFTTSKLQQAAGSRLGYPSGKTMLLAQQLYEGISLEEGPVGLITYMRTDSVRVSDQALEEVRRYVAERFSEKYVPERPNVFKVKAGAQDAHEAIRPTSVYRTPESVKPFLSRDQVRLYTLIWEQFLASQMAEAVLKQVGVDIEADGGLFRATGQTVLFDGFLAVARADAEEGAKTLPALAGGEVLVPLDVRKEVHYTEPPPRFTDATLVKFLEESGIGRPSTYAPIITTLIARYYIERKSRQFVPTFLGRLTNELLTRSFSGILNIEFTSKMEERLDEIADGKLEWVRLIEDFYFPFIESLESAKKSLESYKGITDEETDHVCEKCGRKMVKKLGKFGYFIACPGFPDCRNTMALPLGRCPKSGCAGFVVERKTRKKGRRSFYGCSRYPDCDFVTWDKPAEKNCPDCGAIMTPKTVEGEKYLQCLREGCGHREPAEEEAGKVLVRTER